MYVGAWQEFQAFARRGAKHGLTNDTLVRSESQFAAGISKEDLQRALAAKLDPNSAAEAFQILQTALTEQKSVSNVPQRPGLKPPTSLDLDSISSWSTVSDGQEKGGNRHHFPQQPMQRQHPRMPPGLRPGNSARRLVVQRPDPRLLPLIVPDSSRSEQSTLHARSSGGSGSPNAGGFDVYGQYGVTPPVSTRSTQSDPAIRRPNPHLDRHLDRAPKRLARARAPEARPGPRARGRRLKASQQKGGGGAALPSTEAPSRLRLPPLLHPSSDGGGVVPALAASASASASSSSSSSSSSSAAPLAAARASSYDVKAVMNLLRLDRGSRNAASSALRKHWKWAGNPRRHSRMWM